MCGGCWRGVGDDEGALHAIFNWFKEVMMYYAFLDQGKDPKAEMARVSAAVVRGVEGVGSLSQVSFFWMSILIILCDILLQDSGKL